MNEVLVWLIAIGINGDHIVFLNGFKNSHIAFTGIVIDESAGGAEAHAFAIDFDELDVI